VTVTDINVAGRRVVVVGAGRSGRAAAELLVARGADVTLTEASTTPTDEAVRLTAAGVRLVLGPHRPELLSSAELIVLSPGVHPDQEAVAAARRAGVPVIGEVELASRWLAGRLVAITGTKGKSTTTSLAARMLEEGGRLVTAGGNLGTALSEQVAATRADAIHVVEVSSFQLETTQTFHPWIAVLLNLSPDHLDRHGSFEQYASAKARIFENQTREDWAVINADDPTALELARGRQARRFDFALDARLDEGVVLDGANIVERRAGRTTPLVPLTSVRLPGRHLLADVLAATAVGAIAGVPADAIRRAVERFEGLEHALERVGEIDHVTFVNDSKATNIVAARRAIESFDQDVVIILGGRFKGGRFADLEDAVRTRVTAIVTIGEASGLIESALKNAAPVYHAASMSEAVRRAFAMAPPGGAVLLAPACASFDMFEDYAARGRAFKGEVRRLMDEMTRGGRPRAEGRAPSAGSVEQ
jgi:UDP-N-acetylmuramoylalanine--D-glutamate ligase